MRGQSPRTTKLWRQGLWEAQDGKCFFCGGSMRFEGNPYHPEYATFEHLVPRSKGGTSRKSNLALSHRSCNTWRHDQPIEVFVEELFG